MTRGRWSVGVRSVWRTCPDRWRTKTPSGAYRLLRGIIGTFARIWFSLWNYSMCAVNLSNNNNIYVWLLQVGPIWQVFSYTEFHHVGPYIYSWRLSWFPLLSEVHLDFLCWLRFILICFVVEGYLDFLCWLRFILISFVVEGYLDFLCRLRFILLSFVAKVILIVVGWDPQTHRPTEAQTHKPTDPQTHRRTNPQTHRRTGAQTHKPTVPQSHKPTVLQTHRPIHRPIPLVDLS